MEFYPKKAKQRFNKKNRTPFFLLTLLFLFLYPAQVLADVAVTALPTDGVVASGAAKIGSSGAVMNVAQSTDKAIINWNTFNIGSAATVNFTQPSPSSVALNRVASTNPSQIAGTLNANGRVVLINPAGVVFGPDSKVNVGGLIASTMNMSDSDFLAGKYVFSRANSTGTVLNQGTLTAADGGFVALLAPTVKNEGIVAANMGSVVMAAGEKVTLDFNGDKLISVTADASTVDALVENKKVIQANSGQVYMLASAATKLIGNVVNTGSISANSVVKSSGKVYLKASSEANSSGSISAEMDDGGVVDITGKRTNLSGSVRTSGAVTLTSEGSSSLQADISAKELILNKATYATTYTIADTHTIDITGDLTINSGVTLTAGDATTIKVGGNWNSKGTFEAGKSTVFLTDASQVSNIIGNNTFYNLTCTTPGKNIVFEANSLTTAANLLTIRGSEDSHVKLTSSIESIDNKFGIHINDVSNAQGEKYLEYLDVYYSQAYGPVIPIPAKHDYIPAELNPDWDAVYRWSGAGGNSNWNTPANWIGNVVPPAGNDLEFPAGAARLSNSNNITGSRLFNSILISGSGYTLAGNQITIGAGGITDSSTSGTANRISTLAIALNTATTINVVNSGRTLTISGVISGTNSLTKIGVGSLTLSGNNTLSGGVILNAGILNIGSNTALGSGVGSSFTLSGGTANATTSFSVRGNWTNNGGTFTPGSNTVTFNGASSQVIGGTQATQFNRLTINNTSGGVTLGNNATVAGTLTLTSGIFGVGANTLILNGAIGGTPANLSTTSSSSLVLGSSSAVTIPSSVTSLNALTISGSGNVTLNSNLTIAGALTLAGAGIFGVGARTLTLNGPAIAGTPTNLSTTLSSNLVFGGSFAGVGIPSSVTTLNSLTISNSNDIALNSNLLLAVPFVPTAGKLKVNVTAAGVNKGYDGGVTATVTLSQNFQIVSDVLSYSYSASFLDKNVGNGKTINVSGISINGGKYVPSLSTATTTANITAKTLTITAAGTDKIYDGTNTASVTLLDNRVSGDVLIVSDTSSVFVNKNVGIGKTVTVSGISISGTDAGNYTLSSTTATTTANITARALAVTASGINKIYNGTSAATVTFSDDRISGDLFIVSGTSSFADKNVGTGKTVMVSGITLGSADAGNYTPNLTTTTTADITARSITIGGSFTVNNKQYDGNNTATIATNSLTLLTIVGGDIVTLNPVAVFANKTVASGKTVSLDTAASTITGTDAGNYLLLFAGAPTTTATISPAILTVTGVTANDKVYNGNIAATLDTSGAALNGIIGGDTVSITPGSGGGVFNNKNVGIAKPVTVSGITLTGADAGNYTLTQPIGITADITAKGLIVIGVTANNKVYDGNITATLVTSGATLVGVVGGDTVSISSGSGAFSDKNVGNAKPVTVSGITLTGADAGNYTLIQQPTGITANITVRTIIVTAVGTNKIYDGTNTASVTLLDNRVSGDVLTVSDTSSVFVNKNVGIGKTVTVSGISISGTDAGNYTLSSTTATTAANITARTLAVTAAGINKIYNGTSAATVTFSDDRISGDLFIVSGTSSFADKNVGTGKTVMVSGITLGGVDAANYTPNSTTTTTADITPRALTVTAAAINKVYDSTPVASVSFSDNRVSGDVFTVSDTSSTFIDKNVGNGKTVNVTGINLTGIDADNYTPNTTATTTANITAKTLTITAAGTNKIYDGTNTASVTLLDNRVSGDVLTVSDTSSVFVNKNVGIGKTVTVSGISISGTDAGNYTLSSTTATTTANITARALAVTASGINKIYNGTSAATVTFSDDRISGDALTVSGTSSFADKNVGTGKTVMVSGITLGGADAGNYTPNLTTTTTADITARSITIGGSFTANNKQYDGNNTATIATNSLTLLTIVGGDIVTLNPVAVFANKTVASGKTVSLDTAASTITGTDAGNYLLLFAGAPTTTATISPAILTVTGVTANDKVYNGNIAATLDTSGAALNGIIGGDTVSITPGSGGGVFNNKNVGIAKPVTVSGITLTGADAGNYTLTQPIGITADITAKGLIVIGVTANNKVYDGNITATLVTSGATLVGVVGGDTVSISSGSGAFSDKNVGNAKPVTVSGITLTGADAGNYTLIQQPTGITANITARTITVTAVGTNKIYDGTNTASVTLLDNRVSGDVLIVDGTSLFANKNVGVGKAISVTGINLTGTDAGNYTLSSTTATTTADITRAPLTITADDKVIVFDFDIPALTVTYSGLVGGDTPSVVSGLTVSTSAVEHSAAGRYPITLSGGVAANYTISLVSGTLTILFSINAISVNAGNIIDSTDSLTSPTSNTKMGLGSLGLLESGNTAIQICEPLFGFKGGSTCNINGEIKAFSSLLNS